MKRMNLILTLGGRFILRVRDPHRFSGGRAQVVFDEATNPAIRDALTRTRANTRSRRLLVSQASSEWASAVSAKTTVLVGSGRPDKVGLVGSTTAQSRILENVMVRYVLIQFFDGRDSQ